jgi:hypothetical protein
MDWRSFLATTCATATGFAPPRDALSWRSSPLALMTLVAI